MKKKRLKDRKTPLREAFGNKMKERRLALSLSQEKLADLAGLHFTYISSCERGERNISLENIAKIAEGLNCDLADLMPSFKEV